MLNCAALNPQLGCPEDRLGALFTVLNCAHLLSKRTWQRPVHYSPTNKKRVVTDLDVTAIEVGPIEHVDSRLGFFCTAELDEAPAFASSTGLGSHIRTEHGTSAFAMILECLSGCLPREVTHI